jgi:hypothetical protein
MTARRLALGLAGMAVAGSLALGAIPAQGHAEHGHPAKIHNGTCEELRGVAIELTGVGGTVSVDGTPVPETSAVNEKSAYQVLRGSTEIEATIDQLLAEPRAIMVYESDENMSAILCGNLGGLRVEDELAVGLAEINVPGHTGIAIIDEDEDAPGLVTVSVYVGHALSPVSAGGGTHDDDKAGDDDEGHDDAETTPSA